MHAEMGMRARWECKCRAACATLPIAAVLKSLAVPCERRLSTALDDDRRDAVVPEWPHEWDAAVPGLPAAPEIDVLEGGQLASAGTRDRGDPVVPIAAQVANAGVAPDRVLRAAEVRVLEGDAAVNRGPP